jgi:hypothetical protein
MRILICNIKSCTIKSPTVVWFKRWEHDEKNNMTIREKKEGRFDLEIDPPCLKIYRHIISWKNT